MEKPEPKINEIVLRITGGVTLLEDVSSSVEHEIKGVLSIYSETLSDNEDGSFQKIYKGKLVRGIEFGDFHRKIPVKDKGSSSKKLRTMVYVLWENSESKLDSEQFYSEFMAKLMRNFDSVRDYLKTLK